MKRLLALVRAAIIFQVPAGQQNVDPVGGDGLPGLMQNLNNYSQQLSSTPTSGSAVTLIALSSQAANAAGNVLSGFVQLNAGATGALTVNLPATSAMIAALGAATPLDGSYSEPLHVVNNSGQTATITAGDSNTTLMGSASITTGTVRKFMMRVLNSSNLSITNCGTWGL